MLLSQLVSQSTTKDYIRSEGDFHKEIYIIERTNEAEIKLEEQSKKTESCQANLWNEIQLKATTTNKTNKKKEKGGRG